MEKAIHDFLFGLCFGCGFVIASNVVAFIGSFFHKPDPQVTPAPSTTTAP